MIFMVAAVNKNHDISSSQDSDGKNGIGINMTASNAHLEHLKLVTNTAVKGKWSSMAPRAAHGGPQWSDVAQTGRKPCNGLVHQSDHQFGKIFSLENHGTPKVWTQYAQIWGAQ